jgi:hypothetical protein
MAAFCHGSLAAVGSLDVSSRSDCGAASAATEERPGVSGFVKLWPQADCRELFGKPRAGAVPHRTPGDALGALPVLPLLRLDDKKK